MTSSGCRIAAGDLEALFLPDQGMLGASLKHRGEELLRQVDDLDAAARNGRTAGIPLLYPWANRLTVPHYRAAGKEVVLDPSSRLLHKDEQGVLNHGIPWAFLRWNVVGAEPQRIAARLDWDQPDGLAIFPFRHRVEMVVHISERHLEIATTVVAEERLPVSFGFHPYLAIPGLSRTAWEVQFPRLRELLVDRRHIPNGQERLHAARAERLGSTDFDAGFALLDPHPILALAGAGRRITVEPGDNYRFVQVYAPQGKEFMAIEPMTAPANALVSGQSLPILQEGDSFRAVFRIGIEADANA